MNPPPSPRKYWTRRGLTEWLVAELRSDVPAVAGIDHAFSFPMRYFETHGLEHDCPAWFSGWTFERHWPTDGDNTYVDFIRDGLVGFGALRAGNSRWRRLTEERCKAKSVFRFECYKEAWQNPPIVAFHGSASFASNSEPAFIFGHSTVGRHHPHGRSFGSLPCVMEPSIRERRSKPTPA